MLNKLKNRSTVFYIGLSIFALLIIASIVLAAIGTANVYESHGEYTLKGKVLFSRDTTAEDEGYSEDTDTRCDVFYTSVDKKYTAIITYTYEEWVELGDSDGKMFFVYEETDGDGYAVFKTEPTEKELNRAIRNSNTRDNAQLLTTVLAIAMMAISVGIMVFFGSHFTNYEKIWFLSILGLSAIVAIFLPEEDVNGFSGLLIMALYLADTFLNILCELLISKQSKWNFIVSVGVEIVEILVCLVLAYRFATMAVTLFFWLPCDIASFFNWNKKRDKDQEEITKVRTLKGWQEVLLVGGIVVWTLVIGTLLSELDIATDLFGGNRTLANIVCYLDACASAVGVANGLAILFRFREQWIAWYICAALESIINILAGQYVLLVLKLGYFTNTTYGFIKWSRYIKAHPELSSEKTIL